MHDNAELIDSLYLVKHGVPFDIAFSLQHEERKTWVIALGELDGLHYDRATGAWVSPGGAQPGRR